MTAIDDLIERVESGEGADTALELELWGTIGGVGPGTLTSLDKVVALIEQKLPGWRWRLTVNEGGSEGTVAYAGLKRADGLSASPARALLAATLRAIKEQSHGR